MHHDRDGACCQPLDRFSVGEGPDFENHAVQRRIPKHIHGFLGVLVARHDIASSDNFKFWTYCADNSFRDAARGLGIEPGNTNADHSHLPHLYPFSSRPFRLYACLHLRENRADRIAGEDHMPMALPACVVIVRVKPELAEPSSQFDRPAPARPDAYLPAISRARPDAGFKALAQCPLLPATSARIDLQDNWCPGARPRVSLSLGMPWQDSTMPDPQRQHVKRRVEVQVSLPGDELARPVGDPFSWRN